MWTKEDAVTDDDDEKYENPLDGKTYVGGWKTYEPKIRRPEDPARKIILEEVRLLTSQAHITQRTTTVELIAFLQQAERLADESLGSAHRSFRVMVQFTCEPGRHTVRLAHHGDATQDLLSTYYDALIAAKPLAVSHADVCFQLEFSVRP